MFVLLAVLGEQILWFTGFISEATCAAQALTMDLDWWACVPTSSTQHIDR
jgi:hypothetical protein